MAMPAVFTCSSARLAIRARTPARSVMSISSACLSTSRAWMAAFATASVLFSPADFWTTSSLGGTAADYTLPAAAILHQADQGTDRGLTPPEPGRNRERRPNRGSLWLGQRRFDK